MNIIYIGNALSASGSTPTTIEILGNLLAQTNNVIIASGKRNKISRLTEMIRTVWKHRKTTDFCIIDVYSSSAFYFALVIASICRNLKIPYIPVAHGGNLPERMKKSPRHTKHLFSGAYKIVTPSGFLKEKLEENGYTSTVIRNPIKTDQYPFTSSPNNKNLLWVRSIHSVYNPKMALRIWKRLATTYPDIRLTMVGPEKDLTFSELIQSEAIQQSNMITYTGYLPKAEWVSMAREHAFFLNTTNVDNAPVSVVEAMALGLVVISTNVGGVPYLVEDGVNGFLVEPNDDVRMANIIEACINEHYDLNKIRENARQFALQFDEEKVLANWNNMFAARK